MLDDPYIDPRTGVLRNKPRLATQSELDGFESEKTRARLLQLAANPIPGNFGATHFQSIHRFIFQDVYDWAGELRTVNATKIEGSRATHFTRCGEIAAELHSVFARLVADSLLCGTAREQFVVKGAALLGDLNHIHCFREGNGRAQKCFLEDLALHAGHSLDFSLASKERMIAASIAYEAGNPAPMEHLLTDLADPAKRRQLSDAIEFFESQRYDWQRRELACVQPGHTYSGQLVGRNGNDILFHDGRQGIWIGSSKDAGRDVRSGEWFTYTARSEPQSD
jgi:cell filamentation protein